MSQPNYARLMRNTLAALMTYAPATMALPGTVVRIKQHDGVPVTTLSERKNYNYWDYVTVECVVDLTDSRAGYLYDREPSAVAALHEFTFKFVGGPCPPHPTTHEACY